METAEDFFSTPLREKGTGDPNAGVRGKPQIKRGKPRRLFLKDLPNEVGQYKTVGVFKHTLDSRFAYPGKTWLALILSSEKWEFSRIISAKGCSHLPWYYIPHF